MENHKKVDMKKYSVISRILVLFFCCIIIISSCAVRKSEPIKGREFIPKNDRIANGERLYMANCQKCHPGGEGGLGPAINSNPAPAFIKRFQVRHGLGVMPSFKKNEISKTDLHDISRYMKAWKHYK